MDPREETADPSNPNPNTKLEAGTELRLGLSMFSKSTVNPAGSEELSGGGSSGAASDNSTPVASSLTTAETRSASEMRRFRRREARMKQEEKRRRREIFQRLSRSLASFRSSVGSGFPEARLVQSRAPGREAGEPIGPGTNGWRNDVVLPPSPASNTNSNLNPNPNPNANPGAIPVTIVNPNLALYSISAIPIIPMQVPYNQVQYVAAVNAFGYPCMVPCWQPTIPPPAVAHGQNRTPGSNVIVPLPVRAMPASPLPTTPTIVNREDNVVAATSSSAFRQVSVSPWRPLDVGSSSSVTEHQSSSQQDTNFGISSSSSNRQIPEQLSQVASDHSVSSSQNAPPSSIAAPEEGPLEERDEANMPLVACRGDGSNGSTVFGFLSKSNGNGLVIVCVCHDQTFTPAGFLKHAGAPETAEPLRHILVNTSMASRM